MKLTYQQAYNKVIDAYFKDEIKPLDNRFCFCGTLSYDSDWRNQYGRISYPYSKEEYIEMEDALFEGLSKGVGVRIVPAMSLGYCEEKLNHPNYGNALFEGMCTALEVLKQIHIERGENVDEEIPFVKREINSNKELVNN
jgi:hypothetical protein